MARKVGIADSVMKDVVDEGVVIEKGEEEAMNENAKEI